jgi:hypothetical protein
MNSDLVERLGETFISAAFLGIMVWSLQPLI